MYVSHYLPQPTATSVVTSVTRLEPDLRYCSPEGTDGGLNPLGTRYISPVSDVFSLGVTIFETYRHCLKTSSTSSYSNNNNNNSLNTYAPIVYITCNDVNQHHSALKALQSLDFSFLTSSGLASMVVGMMQLSTQTRMSLLDMTNHSYFSTGVQAIINMIETMASKDVGTQSSQLIALQQDIVHIPPRILANNAIPAISKLCAMNGALWIYALPVFVKVRYFPYCAKLSYEGVEMSARSHRLHS